MKPHFLPEAEIEKKLREFRLSGIVATLEMRIKQAEEDNLGYCEFLGLLLQDERERRRDNKHKKLYLGAHLPFEKDLADFDFSFQPSLKKQEIMEFSSLRFLDKRANILFLGQPGTGKTHLSVALALKALGQGRTVLFTSVWNMINTLQQSRADYSYQKKIQTYVKPDLLILDELGYRSLAESTVEDFFEIVSRRYEKGSIIITSNRSIHTWDKVFIDKTLTAAIIDRLLHHSYVIEIKGDSYRFKNRMKG